MDVKALQLRKDLSLAMGVEALEEPSDGEVTVDVSWAGVCGSDLHVLATGDWVEYWPATLGHEVAGIIVNSADEEWPVGTRVVLDSRMPESDSSGLLPADRLSSNLRWLGEARPGGFAEMLNVSTLALHRCPGDLPLEIAVLAEPLAVVICGLDQLAYLQPEKLRIIGHGPIGMLAHLEARRRWPEAVILVSEPNRTRSRLAEDHGAVLEDDDPDRDIDLVIDAAGYPGSLNSALDSVKRGGSILLLALGQEPADVPPAVIVERSATITGSVGFDSEHLDEALRVLADDADMFRPIVTHRIPLPEAASFLQDRSRVQGMKVLIDCRSL